MNDDILIYERGDTKAWLDTDLDLIVFSVKPMLSREDTILIAIEELDAIHAHIHKDDEPEPAEVAGKEMCGSCRYKEYEGSDFIKCHRYPPTVYALNKGDDFPFVAKADWCGEHRPKE